MILSENLFSFTKFIKLSKYTKPLKIYLSWHYNTCEHILFILEYFVW